MERERKLREFKTEIPYYSSYSMFATRHFRNQSCEDILDGKELATRTFETKHARDKHAFDKPCLRQACPAWLRADIVLG